MKTIHGAAREGDEQTLKNLIEAGTDIDTVDKFNGSALQTAACHGRKEIVEILIKAGADVNPAGGFYGSALQAAAFRGRKAIVKILIKEGADVNAAGGRCGSALQAEVSLGDKEIAEILIQAGADVNAVGGYYGSALQAAVSHGREKVVEILIKAGADVNAAGGFYGSALRAAAATGDKEIVEVLIKAGADVNAAGELYGSALQAAASHGRKAILKILIKEGADVNAAGEYYGSALQTAASYGRKAIVKILIKEGANINAVSERYGSALQAAAFQGRKTIVKILVKEGADVNAIGGRYGSAIQAAASHGRRAIVKILIKAGADVKSLDDVYGSDLHDTAFHGRKRVVENFIKLRANVYDTGEICGRAVQAAAVCGMKLTSSILVKAVTVAIFIVAIFIGNSEKRSRVYKVLQPRWIRDDNEREILVKQSYLINKTDYQSHDWKFEIFIGVHVAIWSVILYIAYRCLVLGVRRQLYETYKSPNQKLELESSTTILKISSERNNLQFGIADRIKTWVQKCFKKPVIWWPLEPPQTLRTPHTTRPSCERGIQFDIPAGSQYSSTSGEASSGASSQQSNSYIGSALASRKHSRMNRRSSKSSFSGNSGANSGRNISGTGHVAIDIPGSSSEVEKYVHWCVDSSKTHLHDICVESKVEAKGGRAFITELLTSYKKLHGIRWWFSLTHCAEVKLVKFFRIVDNMEIVSCLPEKIDITRLLQEKDYDFEVQFPDNDIHIRWVEESVVHYLRHHGQINDSAIESLLAGIPKRVNSKIDSKAKLNGYGMHAQQGWSLIKFTVALAISQFFGLAFFAYWLFHHPGDLQNAAVPYFMILAFIGAAIIVPDIYIP
ncbi:hypothetical protein MMC22_004141 [Lobaria immixta]|nr:hypothetical protein [Lobaria immixta]